MKKLNLIILFILFSFSVVYGQYTPQSIQYYSSPYLDNPAFCGVDQEYSGRVLYRIHSMNIVGSPMLFSASGEKNFSPKSNFQHSLGFIFHDDRAGVFAQNTFNATYAGHIKTADASTLSFGSSLSVLSHRIMDNKVKLVEEDDPAAYVDQRGTSVDINMGVMYKSEVGFLGVSALNLMGSKIDMYTSTRLSRRINVNGGFNFMVKDKKRTKSFLSPMLRMTYDQDNGSNLEGVLSFRNKTKYNHFWVGVGYGLHQNLIIPIGISMNENFILSYTLNYNFSALSTKVINTGHEFMLAYKLLPKRYKKDKREKLNLPWLY